MKIILTIITTVLLLLLAIFLAGGGHGTYIPAKVIYPYTMILAEFNNEIGVFGIILAIVQIPVYVLTVIKKPKWKYYIIGIHLIAVIIVLNLKTEMF